MCVCVCVCVCVLSETNFFTWDLKSHSLLFSRSVALLALPKQSRRLLVLICYFLVNLRLGKETRLLQDLPIPPEK